MKLFNNYYDHSELAGTLPSKRKSHSKIQVNEGEIQIETEIIRDIMINL